MNWPTQSEARWRSTWYRNVISYGAAHQVREARWLRDPRYWQGHVRTWAENEKPDGIYPSHVTPAGPAGGQYTDWITSAAWEGHLVHPDPAFLAQVVDRLAANVRGWQKVYGDGRKGLDVYVDGKRCASSPRLTRLRVELAPLHQPGAPVSPPGR